MKKEFDWIDLDVDEIIYEEDAYEEFEEYEEDFEEEYEEDFETDQDTFETEP